MARKKLFRRHDEVPVVDLQKTNPVRFGAVVIIVLLIVIYFGFTKSIPFKHGFRMNAVFNSALNIHAKSPVRIAGVNVGKVTGIHREGNTGVRQVIDAERRYQQANLVYVRAHAQRYMDTAQLFLALGGSAPEGDTPIAQGSTRSD